MANVEVAARTIALSKETAELLDCKQRLDELNEEIARIQDKLQGYREAFESKSASAYCAMNALIMDLLTEQIDTNSTESCYKII